MQDLSINNLLQYFTALSLNSLQSLRKSFWYLVFAASDEHSYWIYHFLKTKIEAQCRKKALQLSCIHRKWYLKHASKKKYRSDPVNSNWFNGKDFLEFSGYSNYDKLCSSNFSKIFELWGNLNKMFELFELLFVLEVTQFKLGNRISILHHNTPFLNRESKLI